MQKRSWLANLITVVAVLIYCGLGAGQDAKKSKALSQEALDVLSWYETLGYPDTKGCRLVKIPIVDAALELRGASNGVSSPASSEHPKSEVDFDYLWLLEKGPESSKFLTMDLFTVSKKNTLEKDDARWVETSIVEYGNQQLEALRRPNREDEGHFSVHHNRIQVTNLGERCRMIALAHALWRHGEDKLAQQVFDEAKMLRAWVKRDWQEKTTLSLDLERDFADAAMWRSVPHFGDRAPELVTRSELLRRFKQIVTLYPRSLYFEDAKKFAAVLERMVTEDAAHPVSSNEEVAKLSVEEQVKEWIFRLRDQKGAQNMQPGRCSIFGDWSRYLDKDVKKDTPADHLVEIGYPAVPHLIEALSDDRFTRSVGYGRDFCYSHTVLTIGDAALEILSEIAGVDFSMITKGNAYTSDYMSRAHTVEPIRNAVLQWWTEFERKGEKQFLIDAITNGGTGGKFNQQQFTILKKKWPEAALNVLLAGAEKARNTPNDDPYLSLLAVYNDPRALKLLNRELHEAKLLSSRVSAGISLHHLRDPDALPSLIKEWKGIPMRKNRAEDAATRLVPQAPLAVSWSSNREQADALKQLMKFFLTLPTLAAVNALTERWDERPLDGRLEIMEGLIDADYWTENPRTPQPPVPAEVTSAAESFLIHALEDTAKHPSLGINYGSGIYFGSPRNCEIALYGLHKLLPKKYVFTANTSPRNWDIERFRNINIWRQEHGLKLLDVPVYIEREKLAPERALEIASVHVIGENLHPEASYIQNVKNLKGTTLRGTDIVQLLVEFANHPMPGISSIDITADRSGDLTGVELEVRFSAGDWNENQHMIIWENFNAEGVEGFSSSGSASHSALKEKQHYQSWLKKSKVMAKLKPTDKFSLSIGFQIEE